MIMLSSLTEHFVLICAFTLTRGDSMNTQDSWNGCGLPSQQKMSAGMLKSSTVIFKRSLARAALAVSVPGFFLRYCVVVLGLQTLLLPLPMTGRARVL